MGEITEAELVEIGREAAKAVAGEGVIEGVEVRPALARWTGRPSIILVSIWTASLCGRDWC